MSSPATAPPAPNNLRRIVATSLIGTTIEWYGFFLYMGDLLNQRPADQGPQDASIRHSPFQDLGAPMPFSRVTFAAARPILPTAGIPTKPHPTVRRT
ncbi:hypothetical protein [Streptomyces tendae]|uniref:hypothetical protein n=1 Tax=Streptomyces tendae TaxID=1932 RepID=UPI003663BD16